VAWLLPLSSPLKGDITEIFSSPDSRDRVPIEVAFEAAQAGIGIMRIINRMVNRGIIDRTIYFMFTPDTILNSHFHYSQDLFNCPQYICNYDKNFSNVLKFFSAYYHIA
jgi:hypothetical protein